MHLEAPRVTESHSAGAEITQPRPPLDHLDLFGRQLVARHGFRSAPGAPCAPNVPGGYHTHDDLTVVVTRQGSSVPQLRVFLNQALPYAERPTALPMRHTQYSCTAVPSMKNPTQGHASLPNVNAIVHTIPTAMAAMV